MRRKVDTAVNHFDQILTVCLALLLLALPLGAARAAVDFTPERNAFLAARSALAQGDTVTFQQHLASLKHYPLHRHLHYLWFNHQLNHGIADVAAIRAFVDAAPKDYLSRRVMSGWQRLLAETEDWGDYLEVSQLPAAADQACMRLKARHALGWLRDYSAETGELWVSPAQTQEHCAAVFEALAKQGEPPIELVWRRVYRLIESGQPRAADPLLAIFNQRDRALVELWQQGHDKPLAALSDARLGSDSALTRRIVKHLVRRYARQDLPAAHALWQQLRGRYQFSLDDQLDIDRRLALTAAYTNDPRALDWLDALVPAARNEAVRTWRVRSALRQQNWPAVLARLDALTRDERADSQWRYWRARALEAQGKKVDARVIYAALADRTTYYGFLAADRLGQAYQLHAEALALGEPLRERLLGMPEIQRAREYYLLGMKTDARRAWNPTIRQLDVPGRLGAAVLADEWGWHDRAVWSVAQTAHRSDYALRFPTPWEKSVTEAARQHALEEAWIYAVMRRESAFIADVRSRAGAIGLMQLMPATAQFVGRKIGRQVSTSALTNAELNIELGSYYLKHVRERFGHPALATAAYNAGPSRVQSWRPKSASVDADLWVDTMPFTETRKYVRAVMAYQVVFEWRMRGEVTTLAERMPPIPPEKE